MRHSSELAVKSHSSQLAINRQVCWFSLCGARSVTGSGALGDAALVRIGRVVAVARGQDNHGRVERLGYLHERLSAVRVLRWPLHRVNLPYVCSQS
jgi:hypothetical protein